MAMLAVEAVHAGEAGPGQVSQSRCEVSTAQVGAILRGVADAGSVAVPCPSINITKLCTTERDPWEVETLKTRALEHLSRYDIILMLRAIWEPHTIRYQLVDIPVGLLRLLAACEPAPVGRRVTRRSLGADVVRHGQTLFRVHFDGSNGKCQIRNLRMRDCTLLLEWEKLREPTAIMPDPADLPL